MQMYTSVTFWKSVYKLTYYANVSNTFKKYDKIKKKIKGTENYAKVNSIISETEFVMFPMLNHTNVFFLCEI